MKIIHCYMTLVLVLVLVGTATLAQAATVRISWNANSEGDLAGYRVYYGTASGSYSYTVEAGLNTSTDISGLGTGDYYFAVTAYDSSYNESGYSQEVHVLIPEGASGGQTGGSSLDTDMDGIPDQSEELWGMDPNYAMDSLDDIDGDGVVNLVEYMAGTSAIDASDHPMNDNILKDIIGEAGAIIDLEAINPGGQYTIVPLNNTYPAPVNNTLAIDYSGAYLYNVLDGNSALVYRLRISITDRLAATAAYEPGSFLNLADEIFGIRIELPGDAVIRQVPIGIGSTSAQAASAVQYSNGTFQFDILPYGLMLSKAAVITVPCESSNPTVQRYDDATDTWVSMEGVTASDGKVSFSSNQLGTFRVVSGEAAGSTPSDGGGGGGGGGGCFISTAGL